MHNFIFINLTEINAFKCSGKSYRIWYTNTFWCIPSCQIWTYFQQFQVSFLVIIAYNSKWVHSACHKAAIKVPLPACRMSAGSVQPFLAHLRLRAGMPPQGMPQADRWLASAGKPRAISCWHCRFWPISVPEGLCLLGSYIYPFIWFVPPMT